MASIEGLSESLLLNGFRSQTTCPCPDIVVHQLRTPFRHLQESNETIATDSPTSTPEEDGALWEVLFTCAVLLLSFVALVTDRVGADMVMIIALTLFIASGIVTMKEGLEGFSNEGVLTVMALFPVAEGIAKTGALDWYMSKLLGRPKTIAGAQLRLMVPIAIVSAFMNNTPLVAIMIPIAERWARSANVPVQQLMMHVSFASILGGTCTLIGTSTNLVVSGLLEARYPNDPDVNVGLFDLAVYGVPNALVGILYCVMFSKYLLPEGRGNDPSDVSTEDILLGAKIMPWSPAAGRSVKRSGLRNTGGIYLVSVHRAATGNVHRAVGQEFVLNVGDVLYFTGLVEGFAEFCEEHGMEVLTSDNVGQLREQTTKPGNANDPVMMDVGSLMHTDEAERSRSITKMIDLIRGVARDEPTGEEEHYLQIASPRNKELVVSGAHKVVVISEHGIAIVGVDARDRPGLLLDISKGLLRLKLTLRHCEAAVVAARSISIWRCELIGGHLPDLEEIRSVLNTLLESTGGNGEGRLKRKGTPVIRAVVTPTSILAGKSNNDIDFWNRYRAAIIAIQKAGRNISLSGLVFAPGDVLILQTHNDSPLLKQPPSDFYRRTVGEGENVPRSSFVKKLTGSFSGVNVESKPSALSLRGETSDMDSLQFIGGNTLDYGDEETLQASRTGGLPSDEEVWNDLQVLFPDSYGGATSREFLAAMTVAPKSRLSGRTAAESGLDKLPGVFLVSIDRPNEPNGNVMKNFPSVAPDGHPSSLDPESDAASLPTLIPKYSTVPPDTPLQDGDVLWFAGGAQSVGDLRKVPGLVSFEKDEVEKINEKIHERRLVEAVIARRGPLVGKTAKQVQFRTRYGAAIIAVHRDGAKIHEYPGRIRLQAGDVLLLEAGPTFIKGSSRDRAFALLAEVEDSAPPRLRLLIPALVLAATMLAVTTAGLAKLLVCALLTAAVMCAFGILSQQEARDSINWEVFVTVASAFGIGTALVNSGVAGGVAGFLVKIGSSVGSGYAGLYGAVYLATFLISNIVTNNAAAALVFPIAIAAAEDSGADPVLMSYCVMLGASASFATPFGYQTNLMVYGPGRYKTIDFIKLGAPMQIILWILCTVILATTTESNFYISWLSSFAALVVGSLFTIADPLSFLRRSGSSVEKNASRSN